MYNRITILGNLGNDPKRHEFGSTTMIEFSVATEHRQKDKDGNYQPHTTWHFVKCFGNRAEALIKMLQKGTTVMIQGSQRHEKYTDKQGQEKYSSYIMLEECKPIKGLRPKEDSQSQESPQGNIQEGFIDGLGEDGDLPF